MLLNKSSGSVASRSAFGLRAIGFALAVGATITGAGPAMAGESCEVRITEVRLESYTSGGQTLQRARLTGEHNYSTGTNTGGPERTAFDIIDNDGFLTLAIFTARWGNAVRSAESQGFNLIRIPRAELESLYRAVEMGIAYYERGRVVVSEQQPDNLEGLRAIDNKLHSQRQILPVLHAARDYRPSDDTIAVDLGWVILQPGRFKFGPGRDLASVYRDRALGDGTHMLCDREARSLVVGRLACPPPNFESRRDDGVCPDGLTFSPVILPPVPA